MIRLLQIWFWQLRERRWNRLHTKELERVTAMQDHPRYPDTQFEEAFHKSAARVLSLERKKADANCTIERLKR